MQPKPIDTKKLIEQLEAIINTATPWNMKELLSKYVEKIKSATQTT